MTQSVPDFIPTAKAKRGRGPRTKRQMRRRQAKAALDAKLEFAKPIEADEREDRKR